jgi:hypothetical protein
MAGKSAVTLRLGVEGDEKIQAALRQIGKTGDDAMQGLSREAKEAARAFDRLEKSVDAQARSAAQVARAYVQSNAAVAAGVRTQADAQRVLDLAAERHRRLTGAVNDNAHAVGLARHEWINLSRQFQDVGVSLAGGQAPLTVMLQQGSQIADIFGSSQAGAAGALRAFGAGAVRALASPIGAAAGLAAAILGVKAAGDAAAVSLAKLGEEARQTGLNPNRVVGAKIVGARAGLDEKETVGALTNAQKEFEAFSRNSGAVKDSLEKIDKGFLSVADRARNAGEWIDRIVQKIRELPRDQGLSLAKALFGDEGGRKLFDEIQRGAVSMASLSREAERAGANFDASAEHAEKMRREIAEIDRIASTRLLTTFGDLANPVLAMEKSWANMKLGILDIERSLRQTRDIFRFKAGEALGVHGEDASAVFGRMRGQRLFEGKDPFAGKTMADVDPLVNLFTQSDPKSRPSAVGKTRKLFASTGGRNGKSDAERAAERFSTVEQDLQSKIALASVAAEGAAHDQIALKIKIENEQRRIGVGATQEQKDRVAELVTQLDAAERAQKAASKEAEAWRDTLREVGDSFRDAFSSVVNDLRSAKSAGDAFKSVLDQIERKAIDIASRSLTDSLFGGKDKESGSGLLGGLVKGIGGLFGGGKSTGYFSSSLFSGSPFSFGFANGGIMTPRGPLPLRRYATGGIADSPQLAMFGEGRMPEAYVPLPDGRSIPVAMQGGGAPKITINNNAPVDVTPRVMSDGEIILHVERRIASFGKQLSEAPRRANR